MLNTDTDSTPSSLTQPDALSKRVSIQGYAGAFHEIAARYAFQGEPIEIIPAHTFSELVNDIEIGEKTDIGLMAIENTLAGSLMGNYSLLNDSSLKITGEVFLRIKQNLLVLPGQKIEDLTEVHSHPIAIAQCREFFAQYHHIRLVETVDTALSAKLVRENQLKHTGAIASTLAAELYNLDVLAAGIETNKKNHTRFLRLERQEKAKPSRDADKVSLCFSVHHEIGGLYRVLGVLAAYNANLTKIQSAPIIGKPWEYTFFLDFVTEGELSYIQAIDAIRPLTHDLNVMGIYPKGEHYEY